MKVTPNMLTAFFKDTGSGIHCPMCKHDSWTLPGAGLGDIADDQDIEPFLVSLAYRTVAGNAIPGTGALLMMTCQKCYFVRSHEWAGFKAWANGERQ